MLITQFLIDTLTAQAKASPRLRQNYDLRNSEHDQSQRMLNALEPGTMLPIHRHTKSSETVVVLRGKVEWLYYDDKGQFTEKILVEAGGEICGISVPIGQWHTLCSLESGSIVLSCKDGPWENLSENDILNF